MRNAVTSAVLVLFAVGCADSDAPGADPSDSSLAGQLAGPATLEIEPTAVGEGSALFATASALRTGVTADLEFQIEAGDVVVTADADTVSVLDVAFTVADQSVSADVLPPTGIDLVDLEVHLVRVASATAQWSAAGDSVRAIVPVTLSVDWSLSRDGVTYELAPVVVEDLEVLVEATADDGALSVRLAAARDGAFWRWADTFELSGLTLDLRAER